VALWREGLLARKVLSGGTRGYLRHPQLERFNALPDPVAAIDCYLRQVFEEATRRGYRFDAGKIGSPGSCPVVPVTESQLVYEFDHLKRKLQVRDERQFRNIATIVLPEPHPMFTIVAGGVEPWEKVRI
jgi:hypothetical protein